MIDQEEVARIAASLSDEQSKALRSFAQEPRQMGIGMTQFLPGMVEPSGMHHPIFGCHYRLNDSGRAVLSVLLGNKP